MTGKMPPSEVTGHFARGASAAVDSGSAFSGSLAARSARRVGDHAPCGVGTRSAEGRLWFTFAHLAPSTMI